MKFSIREYGRIEGGTVSTAVAVVTNSTGCFNVGPEFNPLSETDKMGRANPYQDITRGRLSDYAL
jgi:hypothetical protein